MKVITTSYNLLQKLSIQTAENIIQNDFVPDIIIGIATGGVYVSRPVRDTLIEHGWKGHYFEVRLSRSSTEKKKKFNIGMLLKMMPYFILNILRNLEVTAFELTKPKIFDSRKENKVVFPPELERDIFLAKSVLLIDDAIDTGNTVLAMKNVIQRLNANVDVKVAVLTVTHKRPFIEPDFTLYRRVLLRCPWAEDYKGDDHVE